MIPRIHLGTAHLKRTRRAPMNIRDANGSHLSHCDMVAASNKINTYTFFHLHSHVTQLPSITKVGI
jgi:hypothetical protein